QSQGKQIDQLLGLITTLLLMAVLIALFGIRITVSLSVYERTREIGLLRAVGLSRRQSRTMVRWEAVIITVFGAVLGTAVGIFFGWAMVQALKYQGLTAFRLPIDQLVSYIVIAGILSPWAARKPARRGASAQGGRAAPARRPDLQGGTPGHRRRGAPGDPAPLHGHRPAGRDPARLRRRAERGGRRLPDRRGGGRRRQVGRAGRVRPLGPGRDPRGRDAVPPRAQDPQ